jgi:hypothetical protein
MEPIILKTSKAVVVRDPRGEDDLEGHPINSIIGFQYIQYGVKKYYRVFRPNWNKTEHYVVCDENVFHKFFKEVPKDDI